MTDIPRNLLILLTATAALGLGVANAARSTAPVKIVKTLAPGVTLTQEIDTSTPLLINVVTVDLGAPGVKATVGVAQDRIGGVDITNGREDVSRYARRHHALVAVNGDYFPYTGDPLGIGIHGGELFSEPWMGNGKGGPREVLGITDDGRALIDKLAFRGVLYPAPNTGAMPTALGGHVAPANDPPSPGAMPTALGGHVASANDPPSKPTVPPTSFTVHGVDRQVGKDEVVVITPLFHGAKVNRPNGTDVVLTGVNLPLRANKIMTGKVDSVRLTTDGVDIVPDGGVILAGGPGKGGANLTANLHPGDAVTFIMGVGAVANAAAGIKVASLPREGDLPSRGGDDIDRTAWTWGRMTEALGGGPRLLAGGVITINAAEDGFDPGFVDFPNPRTAVGLTSDGKHMIIVAVDGRQSISRGVSLGDLAAILQRYGASDGMNLDGGGSTAMAIAGLTVDSPGGTGSERPVADMLVISSDNPAVTIPDWDTEAHAPPSVFAAPSTQRLTAGKGKVQEGQSTQISLKDGNRAVDPSRVIWQGPVNPAPPPPPVPSVMPTALGGHAAPTDDGPVGYVDQRGTFTALNSGTGILTGLYQGHLIQGTIVVTPKPAVGVGVAAVRGTLSKVAGWADNRVILAIRVVRPDGSPVAKAALDIIVTGGKADSNSVTTDADGAASVGITWMHASGGLVNVGSGAPPGSGPTLLSVTLGQ